MIFFGCFPYFLAETILKWTISLSHIEHENWEHVINAGGCQHLFTHNTMDAPLIYTLFCIYVFILSQMMSGFIYSFSFSGLKGIYAIQKCSYFNLFLIFWLI